jgi:hypothetical protein
MTSRRTFIKQLSAAGMLCTLPGPVVAGQGMSPGKIWAFLLHLSFNMWEEYISPHRPFRGYRPDLELSESLWKDAVDKMAGEGMNVIVIDLGDAVRYESHPEIAVHHAWTTARLGRELEKIRQMGMEPIPKLNFSAGHDTWLGEYSRMVSTKVYYDVCSDLIAEVCGLFGKPRFFHLGMDEESASHQRYQKHVVVRQNDLWWNDFLFLVSEVEKQGSRAWIWPDYMLWNTPEQFFGKMPRSVVQSNWYYGEDFELIRPDGKTHQYVKSYLDLNAHGYDQIPTGSFHAENDESIGNTVRFCTAHIEDKHLLGFLQTCWKPTIEEYRERILKGIELAGDAKRWYDQNSQTEKP